MRRSTAKKSLLTAATAAIALIGGLAANPVSPVSAANDDDWLATVNAFRAMSGLSTVSSNADWSAQAYSHSCYMLYNGITHDEVPGYLGYTSGGDTAGNNGNVAVSSGLGATARDHINLWMTGPFHAIGILRHNLATSGFGKCTNSETSPWKSGATLDVLRGINGAAPRPSQAIVFPGRNSTVSLNRFVIETPNPMEFCNWTGAAGLPLIAMMPNSVNTANATITGPNGPIETCVLHPGNTTGTAQAILQSENAVVVMPRVHLPNGTFNVSVNSNGGNTSWSFSVDPNATLPDPVVTPPPPAPTTKAISDKAAFEPVKPVRYADSRANRRVVRLKASTPQTVTMDANGATAVSANFTVDRPSADGFLTVYTCGATPPEISTLNFKRSQAAANQAVVPLTAGKLCLFSPVDTDIIIDVNGYFRTSAKTGFMPVKPARLYDSRNAGVARLTAGIVRKIKVEGVAGGAPKSANAVAINITAANSAAGGYIQAYPCEQNGSEVSNVNFDAGDVRPNSAIVPTSTDGTICVVSSVNTDIFIDMSGYFVDGDGYRFTSLRPIRLVDTRSAASNMNGGTNGNRLAAGKVARFRVAGTRGVPSDAKAASVNLTAVDAVGGGYLTAYPCGTVPAVSNVNTTATTNAIANGAMIPLSAEGDLCVYSDHAVHLLIGINGIWS